MRELQNVRFNFSAKKREEVKERIETYCLAIVMFLLLVLMAMN